MKVVCQWQLAEFVAFLLIMSSLFLEIAVLIFAIPLTAVSAAEMIFDIFLFRNCFFLFVVLMPFLPILLVCVICVSFLFCLVVMLVITTFITLEMFLFHSMLMTLLLFVNFVEPKL